VKAVASFDLEISHSTLSAFEKKEIDMKNNRPIRSTGVSRSNLVVGFKAKFVALLTAASLAMMSGFGDQST
jgi:hypothetical protein